MKPLTVQQVNLTHFRNYVSAPFSFGDRFNLVSGLNGLGKTNLLDAIYYLSVGKSYFSPYDQRIVLHGQQVFRLESTLRKGEEDHRLIIKVRPGQTKEVVLDGQPLLKISDHLGFIPIVFSAPRDIELVTGSSHARRRYVDHLLCQLDPVYLKALMDYNHILQMRNAALKQEMADLVRLISAYDAQLGPLATFIFDKRKWLAEALRPLLEHTYASLAGGKESITCEYSSQLNEFSYPVLADRFWEMDKVTQRTNAGIHKDDFDLSIRDMAAKEYGSQGQIKSLIFSLHLSKYKLLRDEKGYFPILVLDDVFDKLDDQRLHRLMEILATEDYGQIFISDTSRDRLLRSVPHQLVHEIMLES